MPLITVQFSRLSALFLVSFVAVAAEAPARIRANIPRRPSYLPPQTQAVWV